MQIIKRKIESSTEEVNDYKERIQVSYNSDRMLVLRRYNSVDPSQDTLLVLSQTETNAIIRFLKNSDDALPF